MRRGLIASSGNVLKEWGEPVVDWCGIDLNLFACAEREGLSELDLVYYFHENLRDLIESQCKFMHS